MAGSGKFQGARPWPVPLPLRDGAGGAPLCAGLGRPRRVRGRQGPGGR